MYEERLLSHNWLIKRRLNQLVEARLSDMQGLVMDLGCGLRPFEPDILRHASYYIGLDWSLTVHTLVADVVANLNQPIPICNDSVDHVVSFEVLEHLSEPGIMLAEANRILRSSGQLTMSVPFQWWVHEAPWDFQRYTRHGLEYQLLKAGFTDIEIRATTGFWSMWLLKLNYQLQRLVKGSLWRRRVTRAVLIPIWWINQVVGEALDRHWLDERETAGYFVTARKP